MLLETLHIWGRKFYQQGKLSVSLLPFVKLLCLQIGWLLHQLAGQFMKDFTSRTDQHMPLVFGTEHA
jgi:hypothetical protein